MCINIFFICPCRSRCGKSHTEPCNREPYVGDVALERVMEPEHFNNWSCATDSCGYSQSSRMMANVRMVAIVEAQAAGKTLPEEGVYSMLTLVLQVWSVTWLTAP